MEHDDQDIKPEVKNKKIDKPNQSNMPSGSRLISKWIDKEVLYLSLYLIKFLFLKLVFWFLYQISYLVYLVEIYGENWDKTTKEFNKTFNKDRTKSSLNNKYNNILKAGQLDSYKKIIGKKDYQPNMETTKVNEMVIFLK